RDEQRLRGRDRGGGDTCACRLGNPRRASSHQVASQPRQGLPRETGAPKPEDGSMSGAMRKIGEYLGLLEDTGVYDDEYDEQGYADPETPQQQSRRTPAKAQP